MITTKQKWVLSGLLTFSAAIWTPQVVARLQGGTAAQIGVEAGPNEDEMLSIEMEASMGPSAGPSNPMEPLARPVERQALAASSTGSEGMPEASVGEGRALGGTNAIVGEVLRTLRRTEAFGVQDEVREIPDPEGDDPVAESEPQPAILSYLEDHPLRGTIVGETTSVALIGRYRVRLGEMVPGTAATLTKVERGRATLVEGELTLELELRPLETSEALMRERAQALASSGGTNAPVSGEAPEGQAGVPASAAGAPVGTAAQGGTGELPVDQGDF